MMAIYSRFNLATILCLLTLTSCVTDQSDLISSDNSAAQSTETSTHLSIHEDDLSISTARSPLWTGQWHNSSWMEEWQVRQEKSWGLDNLEVISEPGEPFEHILRVSYPAGSASPSVSRQAGVPIGGAQFYANLFMPPQTGLRLSYYVRFSDNFDFVKGGKLPGLFGGDGASGGDIPDGTDGFSTRMMWRRNGDGEVYAYLPTSEDYGTSIGRGSWRFVPGTWYRIDQEVRLNQPSQADGQIRVWIDGELVIDQAGLTFRTVDSLQIDGLFFSTFFGGGDESWATPHDVYADFANFSVSPL